VYSQPGLSIVDNDQRPDLRGGIDGTATSGNAMNGGRDNRAGESFPALGEGIQRSKPDRRVTAETSITAATTTTSKNTQDKNNEKNKIGDKPKKKHPASSTLSAMFKNAGADEAMRLKQRKAREEAKRREEARKTAFFGFEDYGGVSTATKTVTTPVSTLSNDRQPPPPPSDGQLKRNQRFADAFGIRKDERRTRSDSVFEDELTKVVYNDALKGYATDNVAFVMKIERKWKEFLSSGNASCSLPKMNRDMRIIVHEYAQFWNIKTESFDPEPNRYIHCVRFGDSKTPEPLLSVAYKVKTPVGLPEPQQSAVGRALERAVVPEQPVRKRLGKGLGDNGLSDFDSGVSGRFGSNHVDSNKGTGLSRRFVNSQNSSAANGISSGKIVTATRAPLKLAPRTNGSGLVEGGGGAVRQQDKRIIAEKEKSLKPQKEAPKTTNTFDAFGSDSDEESC